MAVDDQGDWFKIDKTILPLSYLHNGISLTGKMTSLYCIGALVTQEARASVAMVLT